MNKDLHDIDELFRSGLEGHEEAPSAGVKESLDAALDKKDAESYKKRFIGWKRTALLLLLLLAGLLIYESGLLRTGSGRSGEITADKKTNSPSGEKHEPTFQNNTAADNTNKDESGSYNKEVINSKVDNTGNPVTDNHILNKSEQKDIAAPAIIGVNTEPGLKKNSSENKITGQKNTSVSEQSNSIAVTQNGKRTAVQQSPDKNFNSSLRIREPLPKDKTSLPQPPDKVNITKTALWLARSIQQLQLQMFVNNDTILKTINAKNTKQKKNPVFKPFWMITGLASYDRAGYRLDSDDPLAVTAIRHREVHEPSFSGGILLTRQLTNHWGLQSGLGYTSTQIGISPQKMYALQLPGGDIAYKFIISSGYAYIKTGSGQSPAVGDSITTSDAKHLLKHISVPLAVKYRIGKNKLSVSPTAGIEANFISSAKVEVGIDLSSNREIVTVNKLNGIKSFYWSAAASAEIQYQVNKKISVMVRPAYRQALSPATKNNVVETFPHSFGIGAGVTIKL